MKNVFRWLFRKNWMDYISIVTQLMLEGNDPYPIGTALAGEPMSTEDATKLVMFIPSAFAKAFYENEGVTFPAEFVRIDSCPKKRECLPYADEEIYQQALAYARRMVRAGRHAECETVAGMSSEYNVVKGAVEKGCELKTVNVKQVIYQF